jgi:hypothetical protein
MYRSMQRMDLVCEFIVIYYYYYSPFFVISGGVFVVRTCKYQTEILPFV